jgi:hypothetical protein
MSEAIKMTIKEEIIAQLIAATSDGFAVVVVGEPGSGKEQLCKEAIERMGLKARVCYMDCIDPSDLLGLPVLNPLTRKIVDHTPGVLDKLPEDVGMIFSGLEYVHSSNVVLFVAPLLNYLLFSGKKRVAFITVPPNNEAVQRTLDCWFTQITGEDRGIAREGAARKIVEIPADWIIEQLEERAKQ